MKNPFRHLLLGTAYCVSLAAPVYADTIQDAVASAMGSHPSVSAARAARDASGETVREQRSGYYPDVSVNATAGRIYGDNATSRGLNVTRGAGYSYLWEGNAAVTQKIYDWGETGNKVDAALAREHAAQGEIQFAVERIALRAAQAYLVLLQASDMTARAADNKASIQALRDRIAVQVEEGGADEAELNRANDFLLLADNAAIEFEGQYQQGVADYIEIVGRSPVSALSRPTLPEVFPASLDSAISQAFAGHPQIMAARQAVIASEHDMQAESTSYLPKVSGQLSYLKRDQDDIIGGEAIDARAVMKADWVYSTGGAQHARVDRARFTKTQAQAQLDEVTRSVERDVRVAWSALDISRLQKQTQESRSAATAQVVETYKTQYEGGKRSLIELMQAESQSFDAAVAYANADYAVLSATYALMAATGQLVPALDAGLSRVAKADVVEPAVEAGLYAHDSNQP